MSLPDDYEIITTTSTDATVKVYVPWTFDGVDELNVWYQNTITGIVYYLGNGDFIVTTDEDGGGVFVLIENTQGAEAIDISIARETPKTQTYSLNEAEALNPTALIEALDKAIKLLQEVALGYDEQNITSVNPFVHPDKVTRADKIMSFDSNGDPQYAALDEALQDPIDYATEWAVKAEDILISIAAGGDGATDYSSLHHAAKSAASAAAALISQNAANASAVAALASEEKAMDWAEEDEDTEVETGQYSAKHWAAKAQNSANPGLSSSFNHRFSTTTTEADPGSARIRYNNSDPALATKMFVSTNTDDGIDLSNIIPLYQKGLPMYHQTQNDASEFITGVLTADAIDNGGWFTLEFSVTSSGTLPANNEKLTTFLSSSGGAGGGILPSANATKTADYTVLSGDVGTRIILGSATAADRKFTLDVSLLADDTEQISFVNKSDYRLEIEVSNTGTMTFNDLATNRYLWKGDGVLTVNGDSATNADIVAGG